MKSLFSQRASKETHHVCGLYYSIMKNIDFDELKKFIVESRKSTYAGSGKLIKSALLDGSSQFEHKQGKYFYRDIYFTGKDNFMGQEVVYIDGAPVWSMVYCGSAEPKKMTRFLKKSLSVLSEKCRFGDVAEFSEGRLRYKGTGEGSMKRFSGMEQMLDNGNEVYKLKYSGGSVLK